ncbi:rod shape-determining protein MreD [Candidatus Daviesbacteria bacterium]|nr:rod shape-determining protein MreD [Candidatus Daviesbacteria bacterium]
MKTLLAILILAAFLQSAILPLNLVLVILLIRAYVRPNKNDLYLAFFFGLLTSFLENYPLGVHSLIYLLLVQLTHSFARLPVAKNIFSQTVLIFISLLVNDLTISLIFKTSWQIWPKLLLEIILVFPVYFLVNFWEERFIFKKEIKLKI